jgi:hypothetical protein
VATDDPGKTDPPETDPNTDPPETDADPESTDPPEDKPKDDVDPEVANAIKRRDAAIKARRKAEEERDALREKYEKDKTDPVAQANSRVVKAEARTVLAASGIPKEDHSAVLGYLKLEDIQVSSDGEVDTDAIQDAVDDLKRIFGKGTSGTKRTPPRIDTRDKGGTGTKAVDPASARRRAMLGHQVG